MVKKSAFFEVKKFSSRMMTEDLDLAFKLNKAGYKVQQSIHRFSTFVPNTLKTRYKQKIRRNSGGTHCFIKYPQIWIKNPLHVIMIASFCILIIGLLFRMIKSYDLFVIIFMQENIRQAFRIVFNLKRWFNLLYITISCSLLSLPYTLPLITHRKNLWKIVLIIPYSFVYVPMYSFVGVLGIFKGIQSYRKLEKI
jgi:cellulose synthase/poly-beta-1,6-N-acetylglucosamine synthase-like glycosyltransferase